MSENMYDVWDNADRHEIRQQFARRDAQNTAELRRLHEEKEPVIWVTLEQLVAMERFVPSSDKIPLYTTPPRREWVGLTDEEVIAASAAATYMDDFDAWEFARAVEAKLKEKNA